MEGFCMQRVSQHLRSSRCHRRGVTLLEITVVVGVIGLLAALIVPAVQQSRRSAHRVQCASQLKQIALAILNFEGSNGHYPKPTTNGLSNRSVQEYLAGYLEIPDPVQAGTNVPLLACPADAWAQGQFGRLHGSYWLSDGLGKDGQQDGVWSWSSRESPVRTRDLTDGLSHTALCAEKLAYPNNGIVDWPSYPEYRDRVLLTTPGMARTLDGIADECEFQAGSAYRSTLVYGAYTHILPPNRPSCGRGLTWGTPLAVTASSQHGGGVNLALADGSVRFVGNNIDRAVWWNIGKRNDGNGGHE